MEQKPDISANPHTPVESVHESVVHERPSLQVVEVVHTAAALHTPQPVAEPSSHRAPVRGVHDVPLIAGSQTWHGFTGFVAPDA